MVSVKILFWLSVSLIAYTYVIYPICLAVMTRLVRPVKGTASQQRQPEDWPFVSLIIAAYREETVILQRIQNALAMDYPADRIEILIGCDGKEDATSDLVQTVNDSRIKLMAFPQRRGKPSVLNDCVEVARGELIAFSDANTFWEPQALKKIVQHFDRKEIGGVCGQLLLIDPKTGENVDGLYWRYENFLKRCEGKIGALLGFNGAIYAIRKSLWSPIPANTIVDDFLIGMKIHQQRQQVVFEEQACAHEETAPTMDAEFHRRARIGAGGFQSLNWLAGLLSPAYGRVAWAFWSHKVFRWFCPLFMVTAFVANVALIREPVYQALLLAQLSFYALAALGRVVPGRALPSRLTKLTSMFVGMNAALAVGFWRWLGNTQSGAWKRTARSTEAVVRQTASAGEARQAGDLEKINR